MERTWILVCNAGGARLYSGTHAHLTLLRELDHPAGRMRGADLVSDRAGRTRKTISGKSPRTAVDPRTPPRAAEARRFAGVLARMLEEGRVTDAYDRLALVAPPHFLGLLQEVLPRQVKRRLAASVPSDYWRLNPEPLLDALIEARVL